SLRVSNIELGDFTAVTGMGMVGNFAAQLARLQGGSVIGIDLSVKRLKKAEECEISLTVPGDKNVLKSKIMDITGNNGISTLIDATGVPAVIADSLPLVSKRGEILLLGSPRGEYNTNVTDIFNYIHLNPGLIEFKGAHEWRYPVKPDPFVKHSIERNSKIVFELIKDKRLKVEPLLTHILKPEQAEKGYNGLKNNKDEFKALNSGKHVLCEKPMALNAGQAREMVNAAGKSNKKLMIALCCRFKPESMALKSMIDDGVFGDIYHAQVVIHRRRGIPGLGGWFTTKSKSGGGPLIDIGVHVIDLTLHMMGYPRAEAVSAATYTKFGNRPDYNYVSMWAEESSVKGGTFDVEDYATALVRLEGDMTMNLDCSWAANIGEEQLFTMILGDKRGAKLSDGKLEVFGEDCGHLADFVHQYRESNSFENEARHFAQAILDDSEPMASGKEVINLQLLIDGIYSSAKEKKEVKIGE
ncbi:zinc-binding dehydrogenase, partial [bacterium]|nr:zinc-binding dehydrogenase [bacterium]